MAKINTDFCFNLIIKHQPFNVTPHFYEAEIQGRSFVNCFFFFLQIYTQLSRQEVAQKTDAADWLQETKKLRNKETSHRNVAR